MELTYQSKKKSFKHENNKYAIMQLGNNNPSSTLIIINFTHELCF